MQLTQITQTDSARMQARASAAPVEKRATAALPVQPGRSGASRARYALLVLVGAMAFLPISVWVNTDVNAPTLTGLVPVWVFGFTLVLVLAYLAAKVLQRDTVHERLTRLRVFADQRWWYACVALLFLSLILNAFVARAVFGGFPLHIDELTQALQARIFAQGRLWSPTPLDPEFTSTLLMVDQAGRRFAQFPPGWSLLLAVGDRLGVAWLIGPIVGASAAAALIALLRGLEESRAFTLVAAALFVVSPWVIFNAATQMNHTATMMWLLLASAALVFARRGAGRTVLLLAGAGFCLGATATMRPLDALAFGLPAAAWLINRTARERLTVELTAFGVGLAVPLALLLGYNLATTGAPFVFGYEAQWGATHGLGFHAAPWGPAHTPVRALALMNKNLLRLQQVLFDAPVPALLAPLAALALARKLSEAERYLLSGACLLGLGYFLYWHDGEYLGPRFLLPLAPLLIIATARLPRLLGERTHSAFAARWASCAILLAVIAGWFVTPGLARAYATSYTARRIDADALAATYNVRNAVVFVPSAWGAQLTPRLWALGVPHTDAQLFSEQGDLCRLESAILELERTNTRDQDALNALRKGLSTPRDNAVAANPTGDDAKSASVDAQGSALCRARAQAERAGTWSLLPWLLARQRGNVFVRDLHERNEALFRRFRGPFYIVRPDSVLGLSKPKLVPLNVDSARWEWTISR